MPELPEVETVRRQLEEEVQGKTITHVEVRYAGRINMPAEQFSRTLRGMRILAVRRRAKLLMVELEKQRILLLHLKMSGRLLVVPGKTPPSKHTHIVISLNDGRELHFEDTRKFGYIYIMKKAEAESLTEQRYGPEPLDPAFTAAQFGERIMKHPKRKIKPHLLDQRVIAGVGNIYADEACHLAGVHPTRSVATLDATEQTKLYESIREVLTASIARRGTSAEMFVDLFGNTGTNLEVLQVYGREGQACNRCGSVVEKIRLAGRGTHFCPQCQQ